MTENFALEQSHLKTWSVLSTKTFENSMSRFYHSEPIQVYEEKLVVVVEHQMEYGL